MYTIKIAHLKIVIAFTLLPMFVCFFFFAVDWDSDWEGYCCFSSDTILPTACCFRPFNKVNCPGCISGNREFRS